MLTTKPASTLQALSILLGLQLLVALSLFFPFITGQAYFAYFDIGSDSYWQVVPDAMHMARQLTREGFTGWSFEFGLGGPTALLIGDTLGLAHMLGGPDGVLSMRIWVYLTKIVLGGIFFLLLLRLLFKRWETSVIAALAYSFCGFMTINGQWDIEATEFVLYPMLLWAIAHHLKNNSLIVLPIAVAFTLSSSVFFAVSASVFFTFCALLWIVTSNHPLAMLKKWTVHLLPLIALGYLLSAPRLLPLLAQVLDSSRISGSDALFEAVVRESLGLNSGEMILQQISGLFHKDLLGIGDKYRGYKNYFEGPGFYIGVTFLVLIPQLYLPDKNSRKVLFMGILLVCAYFLFPVFRNMAVGFSAFYFRVSTLWVSLVLLLLASKAVDQAIEIGINRRLLLVGVGWITLAVLLLMNSGMTGLVKLHALKVFALCLLAGVTLFLFARNLWSAKFLPIALLALIVVEIHLVNQPSYFEDRKIVTPESHRRMTDDGTQEALLAIRNQDKGVYRIEKMYETIFYTDSLAQNYMGIKSYYLHSKGMVDFFIGMGLIPPPSPKQAPNYTNLLPNAGGRYMLNSLLGVKYILSKTPVNWEGWERIDFAGPVYIYKNNYALPFGIVQTQQVTQKMLASLIAPSQEAANIIRDVAIVNAVVMQQFDTSFGQRFALDELLAQQVVTVEQSYFSPARKLQQTGLNITSFASNKIAGSIRPDQAGMLVFSIPFNSGWSLKIDGQPTPLVRANYGMLAAKVAAGPHTVELDFELPGQQPGLLLGALGVLALAALVWARKRSTCKTAARGLVGHN